jgi:hypothetical protein
MGILSHFKSCRSWCKSALPGFLFLLALSGAASLPASASPSLILLEDNGESNLVYRQVMESLGAVIVANNLGRHYDHIDVLTGPHANREEFFAQIRKRSLKSIVDVVILTHGADKRLILSSGNLTESDILAAGPFPRLRMVYMMACYSASLLDAWHTVGAQVVVGHQDINSLPGFFFPRFLREWAEGKSVHEAAANAYRFSEGTAQLLSTYIKEQDLLNTVGVGRSEPVVRGEPLIHGLDLDFQGRTYPDHSLSIEPLQNLRAMATQIAVPNADFLVASPASRSVTYAHSDFEKLGISLLGSMIPQATLNVDTIPSAQALVDQIKNLAWAQLQDSFPIPSGNTGSFGDVEVPVEVGQQIWIDGEALRYFMAGLANFGGEKLQAVLAHIQGVRLTRLTDSLSAAVYFNEDFTIAIQGEATAPNWQPYAIHVPKAVRFSLKMAEGVLTLWGLDEGHDALNLQLKMPALPDTVYVRNLSANLTNGKIQVEAGVIGNLVTVVAGAEVTARKFTGVDIWESISRNLSFANFPLLNFKPL